MYLRAEKILPIVDPKEYYVDLLQRPDSLSKSKGSSIRRSLPRILDMLKWGVVKEKDIIVAKGKTDEAMLLANGNVLVDGKEQSLQMWLKGIYGWSSVQTYSFTIHKGSGKTLGEIRQEYMERIEKFISKKIFFVKSF